MTVSPRRNRVRRLMRCLADIWDTFSHAYDRVYRVPIYCNLYVEPRGTTSVAVPPNLVDAGRTLVAGRRVERPTRSESQIEREIRSIGGLARRRFARRIRELGGEPARELENDFGPRAAVAGVD